MPKMRGFKPEIWTDEKFVELEPLARLLFMGMWNYSCDNGHLDDKPKQIKMRVLPTDDCDAAALIQNMVDLGMVRRDPDGLTVPKLRDHQRLDNRYFTWCDRCALDEIPEPSRSKHPGNTSSSRRAHDGDTASTRVAPSEGRKEGNREGESEGEGTEGEVAIARKRAHQLPDDFVPNDTNRRIAAERGVDLRSAFDQFADHHRAKGSTFKDWHLAFNTWLRRERPSVVPARTSPLTDVRELEQPPDGLTDAQYAAWAHEQALRRRA